MASWGEQAFLFRDPTNKGEKVNLPIARQCAVSCLPMFLYQIQDNSCPIASFKGGNIKSMQNYSTKFTPHAMRVSQITAMVLDYEIPVPIVAKIVGHSQVIMTIYYTKVDNHKIKKVLSDNEERALSQGKIALKIYLKLINMRKLKMYYYQEIVILLMMLFKVIIQ